MKLYEYGELSPKAKKKAKKDYIMGWIETHDETMSDKELDRLLHDSDLLFDSCGEYVEE